ncbi:carbonic anhydrase [Nitrosomonas aestuarii]|uniref:Carbonic anhydrase n=1 Tax=Nitrosomonas aestuarii TaxID=52441 RepID=A0A1I4G4U6_9PROT|nr:carbonic anhydrase [Nitrosomonas aestuarii]SFL24101.1 carbonic anhydrase [Nitrosomonas aestuarii]
MCQTVNNKKNRRNKNQKEFINKRSFLKLSAITAASFSFPYLGMTKTGNYKPAENFKPAPPKPQNILSPEKALKRLMKGNKRYVLGKSEPLDFHDIQRALIGGQNPYAAILGCSDSRVSPEHCFDETQGDLFVARNAGNYLTHDNIATLEYAVAVLHTPLIMVLGHESCGAVQAAIEAVDHYKDFPGHIQLLASSIAPAVRSVNDTSSTRLVNVTKRNIVLTVERLRTKSPVLDFYHDNKKILIVGGLYHLDTGEVELIV